MAPGAISVVRDPTGEVVYEGPDASMVPALTDELVNSLNGERKIDPIVRGAMAHLNLTMIHPFKDGNGRMARALQTLIMARDGILSPVFCSIEEWLGRNTQAYYDILAETGQGHWHPERDALPWVRFCIRAHYQQAATLIQRTRAMSRAFDAIEKIIASKGLMERMIVTLVDATFGFRVRASQYQKDNDVSDVVASRDLRKLCDAGLLTPIGEKRGRYYVAATPLREIYRRQNRRCPRSRPLRTDQAGQPEGSTLRYRFQSDLMSSFARQATTRARRKIAFAEPYLIMGRKFSRRGGGTALAARFARALLLTARVVLVGRQFMPVS